MDLKRLVSVALLTLSLVAAVGPARLKPSRGRPAAGVRPSKPEPADLVKLRHEGNALYAAGNYLGAIQIYERGYQESLHRDSRSALRFLNNLAGANYRIFRFRSAVKAYLQARALATSEGDLEVVAAVCSNLSSLYFQLGEEDAAIESANQGLALPPAASAKFRSKLLTQAALIESRTGHWDRATRLARQAIEESREELDVGGEALAWNELGNALLEWKHMPAAEDAMLESFRLRKLTHDDSLHFSFLSLAVLHLAQDPETSLRLLNRAIEVAGPQGPGAVWRPLYQRGLAKQALSRPEEAYADFAASIRNFKAWRTEGVPADAFRVGTDGEMHQLYSSFIEVAGLLYREKGQAKFAEDSFAAAEDGRAASLRMLWAASELPSQLPQDYWRALAELQKAKAAELAGKDDGAMRRLRVQLAEMEAGAGLDLPPELAANDPEGRQWLQLTRQSLGAEAVYLGFHTGNPESRLWVITQNGFEFLPLPSEEELKKEIADFVKALRASSPTARVLGRELFQRLFGHVSAGLLNRPTWVVDADGPLFELPFGALVEGASAEPGKSQYVIERHVVRIVPGVSALLRAPAVKGTEMFVGVGDPIYNRADSRLAKPTPSTVSSKVDRSKAVSANGIELPRLLGSGREVESCAKIWQSNGAKSEVLKGEAANKQELEQALRSGPSVVHVAAHMLFPPQGEGASMVALSLRGGNQVELLSDTETAGLRAKLGLVVLNGCSSGQAEALPGSGLMGMTRAWLAAGAHAVIVTRWPTPDQDSGGVFLSLYRLYFLRRGHGAVSFGSLLREAQLAELQAGGARADPARWASYFCVETN